MKLKNLSYLLVGSLIVLSSCKKDDPIPDPDVPAPSAAALTSFIASNNSNAVQSFTIDAAAPALITGAQGTTVHFFANSFEFPGGAAVTGNVNIQLTEIYSLSDIVFLNKQTLGTNGTTLAPLTTGGEFKITAWQNGTQLDLKPGYSYNVTVQAPNGVDPNMDVFYSSSSEDTLVWTQSDSSLIIAGNNLYDVYFDSLGWINCDYFSNMSGPQTNVTVDVPEGFNNTNCLVMISFDGLNSITSVYGYQSGNFTTGPYYTLPEGMAIHIIALAFINNEPHAAIIPATITTNHLEVISALTATTESQLAADINALP